MGPAGSPLAEHSWQQCLSVCFLRSPENLQQHIVNNIRVVQTLHMLYTMVLVSLLVGTALQSGAEFTTSAHIFDFLLAATGRAYLGHHWPQVSCDDLIVWYLYLQRQVLRPAT